MSDPSAITALAISAEDLVAAAAADARDDGPVVLRVTPPFSGRMRARIHRVQAGDADDGTLHIEPGQLLDDDLPPLPSPDQTEDDLRAAADEAYSVERHREYHAERVAAWRERVPDHVVESVVLPGQTGPVDVSLLGP